MYSQQFVAIQARTPGARSKMKLDFSSARATKRLRLEDDARECSGTPSAINSVDIYKHVTDFVPMMRM
jgi:hypothetical protein